MSWKIVRNDSRKVWHKNDESILFADAKKDHVGGYMKGFVVEYYDPKRDKFAKVDRFLFDNSQEALNKVFELRTNR